MAILSAFDGVAAVPAALIGRQIGACDLTGLEPLDAFPLVLSHEVVEGSLDASDFAVTLGDGRTVTLGDGRTVAPRCATLAPADEENEDRTVLLVGDFGGRATRPAAVEIVAELRGEPEGGRLGVDLRGASIDRVVPLAEGPGLVLAEVVSDAELELDPAPGGPDCPAGPTRQVVRTVWAGGVTGWLGVELGDRERERMVVDVATGEGEVPVVPFALGDLGDGDNDVDLCLDVEGRPLRVRVEARTVTDPVNDWNPATAVDVGLP